MGLFGKKKMTEMEWCEDFYDRQMFGDEGERKWAEYATGVYKQLSVINSGISSVELHEFSSAYNALCLEVTGLTWQLYKREFVAYQQSSSTKHFVPDYLWHKMIPYNEAIRVAVELYYVDKIEFVTRKRAEAIQDISFLKNVEHLNRVQNRVEAYKPWFARSPHVCLATALFHDIGVEENNQSRELLLGLIHNFVGGVGKEVRSVKIV